jgi:hypothetical protein
MYTTEHRDRREEPKPERRREPNLTVRGLDIQHERAVWRQNDVEHVVLPAAAHQLRGLFV